MYKLLREIIRKSLHSDEGWRVRIIVGRFKFPHERQLLVQVAQLPEQLAIANSS